LYNVHTVTRAVLLATTEYLVILFSALNTHHEYDDPNGDTDDDVDVGVDLLHEDGPAAAEVILGAARFATHPPALLTHRDGMLKFAKPLP